MSNAEEKQQVVKPNGKPNGKINGSNGKLAESNFSSDTMEEMNSRWAKRAAELIAQRPNDYRPVGADS